MTACHSPQTSPPSPLPVHSALLFLSLVCANTTACPCGRVANALRIAQAPQAWVIIQRVQDAGVHCCADIRAQCPNGKDSCNRRAQQERCNNGLGGCCHICQWIALVAEAKTALVLEPKRCTHMLLLTCIHVNSFSPKLVFMNLTISG